MASPGHCSLLSQPQHSVEHSNRSRPHPATDLHPQLHPEPNESEGWREGEEVGAGVRGELERRSGWAGRCAYRFIMPALDLSGLTEKVESEAHGVI